MNMRTIAAIAATCAVVTMAQAEEQPSPNAETVRGLLMVVMYDHNCNGGVMAKETKAYIKSVASRASADDIKAAGDYVKGLVGNKQITWGQWCGAMEDNGIATYTAALDAKFRPPVEKELDSKFRPRVGKKRVYTQMAPELTNGAPLKMDPYRPTCISYLLGLVTACR